MTEIAACTAWFNRHASELPPALVLYGWLLSNLEQASMHWATLWY
jgi:hypothetical protein